MPTGGGCGPPISNSTTQSPRHHLETAVHVYWMTHETNATARKLYDSVARRTGFIEYDILK
jgi:hypothetical protein